MQPTERKAAVEQIYKLTRHRHVICLFPNKAIKYGFNKVVMGVCIEDTVMSERHP